MDESWDGEIMIPSTTRTAAITPWCKRCYSLQRAVLHDLPVKHSTNSEITNILDLILVN